MLAVLVNEHHPGPLQRSAPSLNRELLWVRQAALELLDGRGRAARLLGELSNSVEPVTRIGFEELTTLYAVMPQRQGWRRAAQRSAGRLGAGARAFGGSGWTPIDIVGPRSIRRSC